MRADEPVPAVDDFLPPELRVPSHDQLDGRMMPWPIVLDGEMVECATCGTYRDWLVLSPRDQIWLRCRAGRQQHERRLDTAWHNRHAGPADATHATFTENRLRGSTSGSRLRRHTRREVSSTRATAAATTAADVSTSKEML